MRKDEQQQLECFDSSFGLIRKYLFLSSPLSRNEIFKLKFLVIH